jgi:superoxide dismutase, Cu-Zn family
MMERKVICLASVLIGGLILGTPAFAADKATAVLMDPDGNEVGTVTLFEAPSGVLLDVDLTAVLPGDHAFHIHAVGQCETPDFKSAGGHFNPEEDKHGLLNKAGPHAGDMPNIHVPETGKLRIEILNQRIDLNDGLLDDDGSAIVIHEGPDDYITDPAGDAGPRIACGVITAE